MFKNRAIGGVNELKKKKRGPSGRGGVVKEKDDVTVVGVCAGPAPCDGSCVARILRRPAVGPPVDAALPLR